MSEALLFSAGSNDIAVRHLAKVADVVNVRHIHEISINVSENTIALVRECRRLLTVVIVGLVTWKIVKLALGNGRRRNVD